MFNTRMVRVSSWIGLTFFLIFTLIPVFLLIFLSLKDSLDILMNFWGWPEEIHWANYSHAYNTVKNSIGNSLYVCAVSVIGTLFLGSLSGYVFARLQFPGKSILYLMLLGILMVPSVLTLVPLYAVVAKLKLIYTYWGLILPYIAGSQLLCIVVCRSFFETIPGEMFEAGRIDGGSEFLLYRRIALPLSIPVLITVTIVTFLGIYNDYLWPLLVLNPEKFTFSVAVVNLSSSFRQDIGLSFAAYVIGSVPTVVIMMLGMRYYVQGIMSGAVKV